MCHQQHWRRGCASTDTLCPVPWGHTGPPAQLFMKGHVALENLNGGINNQMSASIVFDRLPLYSSLWGMACCKYNSPCRDGASGLDVTAVTPLEGAPLHLVTGATRLHSPLTSPPPLPPSCSPFPSPHVSPLLAWLDAGMPRLTPGEKV